MISMPDTEQSVTRTIEFHVEEGDVQIPKPLVMLDSKLQSDVVYIAYEYLCRAIDEVFSVQ
jgi:hypothetical protein